MEARLQSLQRQLLSQGYLQHEHQGTSQAASYTQQGSGASRQETDSYAWREFRARDAERKRAEYWKKKNNNVDSSAIGKKRNKPTTSDVSGNVAQGATPNRRKRSVQSQVSLTVSDLLCTLDRFNLNAKKLFFTKLLLHPSLKQYVPAVFGTRRRDLAILAAVTDLKECLRRVKSAKRKDHLGAKQVLTIALAGESTVVNRNLQWPRL